MYCIFYNKINRHIKFIRKDVIIKEKGKKLLTDDGLITGYDENVYTYIVTNTKPKEYDNFIKLQQLDSKEIVLLSDNTLDLAVVHPENPETIEDKVKVMKDKIEKIENNIKEYRRSKT